MRGVIGRTSAPLPAASQHVALNRRAMLTVWALVAANTHRLTAEAIVEGIPLYAPGDQIALPQFGFETQLPRLEALRDVMMPALQGAVEQGEWAAAAKAISGDALAKQLTVLGDTASILGDEAYTALSIKGKYASSAKKLQTSLSSAVPQREEIIRGVGELDATLREYMELIPDVVVRQVRAREAKLSGLRAGEPAATPAAPPTPSTGGILQDPRSQGQMKCGVDIRC